MTKPTLLGLSGSLRRNSYNTAILNALKSAIAANAGMDVFPLNDVPVYNQDTDTENAPEAVAAMRRAIGKADAVIIASPEYNHGMSGVIKNALDWASRPYGSSTLIGKPVLTITASPGAVGGARAHAHLNDTLLGASAKTLPGPQIVVPFVQEKMQNEQFEDNDVLKFMITRVEALLAAYAA